MRNYYLISYLTMSITYIGIKIAVILGQTDCNWGWIAFFGIVFSNTLIASILLFVNTLRGKI